MLSCVRGYNEYQRVRLACLGGGNGGRTLV